MLGPTPDWPSLSNLLGINLNAKSRLFVLLILLYVVPICITQILDYQRLAGASRRLARAQLDAAVSVRTLVGIEKVATWRRTAEALAALTAAGGPVGEVGRGLALGLGVEQIAFTDKKGVRQVVYSNSGETSPQPSGIAFNCPEKAACIRRSWISSERVPVFEVEAASGDGFVSLVVSDREILPLGSQPSGLGTTGDVIIATIDEQDAVRLVVPGRSRQSAANWWLDSDTDVERLGIWRDFRRDVRNGWYTAKIDDRSVYVSWRLIEGTSLRIIGVMDAEEATRGLIGSALISVLMLCLSGAGIAVMLGRHFFSRMREVEMSAQQIAFEIGEVDIELRGTEFDNLKEALAFVLERYKKTVEAERKASSELRSLMDGMQQRLDAMLSDVETMNQRLVNAARLSELGEMAAWVAHDIGQPLTVLRLSVDELITDDGTPASVDRAQAQQMNDMVIQITRISQGLRNFVKGTDLDQRERVTVHRICVDAELMSRPKLRSKGVRVDRAGPDLTVRVNGLSIQQVFVNLINNAVDAFDVSDTEKVITITWSVAQERVHFKVRDNGAGMEPDVLARVFDWGFSTKGAGGSGFGVRICQRIVEAHGGRLTVESLVGAGTVFSFDVPLAT